MFDHIIGQEHIKHSLTIYANAAQNSGRIPHILFEGSKGSGKSMFMGEACRALRKTAIPGAFKKGQQMDAVISRLRGEWRVGSVWCPDEIHNGSKDNHQALKTLIDEGFYTMNSGDILRIPELVVFSATTDLSAIDDELLDRFTVMRLIPPTYDEKVEMAQIFATNYKVDLSYEECEQIAVTQMNARGIRMAIEKAITLASANELVNAEGVLNLIQKDEDGLDIVDQKILLLIAEALRNGRKLSAPRAATKLQLTKRAADRTLNILESTGFIATDNGGRTLTEKGWDKVDELRILEN